MSGHCSQPLSWVGLQATLFSAAVSLSGSKGDGPGSLVSKSNCLLGNDTNNVSLFWVGWSFNFFFDGMMISNTRRQIKTNSNALLLQGKPPFCPRCTGFLRRHGRTQSQSDYGIPFAASLARQSLGANHAFVFAT